MEKHSAGEGAASMEKTVLKKQRKRGGKPKGKRSKKKHKGTGNKVNTNKKKEKETENLEVNLINVNKLTKEKFAEIEKTFLERELNILCMTETE